MMNRQINECTERIVLANIEKIMRIVCLFFEVDIYLQNSVYMFHLLDYFSKICDNLDELDSQQVASLSKRAVSLSKLKTRSVIRCTLCFYTSLQCPFVKSTCINCSYSATQI